MGIGSFGGSTVNTIEYITIASAGNATDFGDLTVAREYGMAAAGTTYGVFAGGQTSGGKTDTMDYITIASTGNASDFGDLTDGTDFTTSGCSSSHGGLA